MIRVGIVEDHRAIAEGLAALIGGEDDIEIVWLAGDQQTATRLLASDPPDAVLCDVMLGGSDAGFDLLDAHGQRSRFVMYSAFDFPAHHARSLQRGAAGFVSKVAPAEQIVAAIRKVHRGRRAFARAVLQSARQAARPPTERELALVRLLVEGASNDAIAEAMSISPKTVEGWVRRMFDRYGCANRTQRARFAMRQGWLTGR
jgi:DNA-binding NarL/FixJ family response regulator